MPPTSVLRSRQPLELVLPPGGVMPKFPPGAPPIPVPHTAPVLLPGKPPSFGPPCPYIRSISRPSTALTRPTANSKSGRNRVRAYQSASLDREKLPSYTFLLADTTWSNRPTIVTFGVNGDGAGAGACAKTGGAAKPKTATAAATAASVRLIQPPPHLVGQ